MIELRIKVTKAELAKLQKLAEVRSTPKKKLSIEDCIRSFARACQPGGSGWKHPSIPDKKDDGRST